MQSNNPCYFSKQFKFLNAQNPFGSAWEQLYFKAGILKVASNDTCKPVLL